MAKCRRADQFNAKTSHICEQYFSSDVYERDLKAELLGLTPEKHLKKLAVPSLELPSGTHSDHSQASSSRQSCHLQREKDQRRTDIVNALLSGASENLPEQCSVPEEHPTPEREKDGPKEVPTDAIAIRDVASSCDILTNVPQLKSKVSSLERQLSCAQVRIRMLKKEVRKLLS